MSVGNSDVISVMVKFGLLGADGNAADVRCARPRPQTDRQADDFGGAFWRQRGQQAQQAIDEANRKAEADRIAEEKRRAQEQANIPPPPPVKPDPPKRPIKPTPQPIVYGNIKDNASIEKKSNSGRIAVVALTVALLIAIIIIVAISNSHPSNATIVQGDNGSTDSGTTTPLTTQPTAPATTTPATTTPIPPPASTTPATKRSTAPNANAKQQFAVSQALGKQGNWVGAAKAGELALSLDPQSEDILQYVSFIDHEQLFKFERAYELDQMRIALGYGQDDFVEANLTASRFASCASMAEADGRNQTEARLKIVMLSLQYACLFAERNVMSLVAGAELRRQISGLQKVGWTFNGTEHFVLTNSAFAPNGRVWAALFQALTNGDEKTALEALTALGVTG